MKMCDSECFLSDLHKSLSLKACLRREPFSNRTVSCSSVARALPQLWDFNTVPPTILKCFKCRHKHHTALYRKNTGAVTQVSTVLIISKLITGLSCTLLPQNVVMCKRILITEREKVLLDRKPKCQIGGLDLEKAFAQVLWGMYVYKIARIWNEVWCCGFSRRERK